MINSDYFILICFCIFILICLFIYILTDLIYKSKEKKYKKENPDFIVQKTYGIGNRNIPNGIIVSTTKLYGETIIICPKCHSKKVREDYSYFFKEYKCLDCHYRKLIKG